MITNTGVKSVDYGSAGKYGGSAMAGAEILDYLKKSQELKKQNSTLNRFIELSAQGYRPDQAYSVLQNENATQQRQGLLQIVLQMIQGLSGQANTGGQGAPNQQMQAPINPDWAKATGGAIGGSQFTINPSTSPVRRTAPTYLPQLSRKIAEGGYKPTGAKSTTGTSTQMGNNSLEGISDLPQEIQDKLSRGIPPTSADWKVIFNKG
jgi:hypothetical protein